MTARSHLTSHRTPPRLPAARAAGRTTAAIAVTSLAVVALAACGSSSKSGGSTPAPVGAAPTTSPGGAAGATTSGGTGGGTASAPGITPTEVLIGTTQPLTGPAAPGYSKISAAMTAYFDYVNAAGGVNGRKISLKVVDDGYNPATTATATRQLVLSDKVFATVGSLGTPTQTAVLDFLKTNKVPDLFVSSGSRSWDQPQKYPTTFGWQPDYTVEGKILGSYIKKTYAGKKVCSFGQGDDFGTDGAAGVELSLGKGSLATKQTYDPTNTNVGPQVGALKAAGCQVVVSFTVPGFTALEIGTAAQTGFMPQYVISNVGADYPTLQGFLKANTAALLEGAVSDDYVPLSNEATNPWNVLFQKVDAMYDNNAPYDGNVEYGMSLAYTFVQALQAAGPNPTRASIIAAVEKGGFTGPGLVPFRFSSTVHAGYAGVQIASIIKGVPTAMGPVYTTDDTDAAIQEYTQPAATPPASGIPG